MQFTNMSNMENSIAVIDIASQFPADKYNILIPQKTIMQMSPFHRISVNFVMLDPDPANGDVYDLQGKLAPTKNGILKLARAAGIQVKHIKSVTPSGCERCMEAASRTKIPPACRECPDRDNNIAVEVAVLLPDGAGGYRATVATREWLAEDEKEAAQSYNKATRQREPNAALFAQAKRFKKPITESKALLRAIRSALSAKNVYTANELAKPFVVPVVTLNYDDPALREAVTRRLASGMDAIFGGAANALPMNIDAAQADQNPAIEAGVEIVNDDDATPPADEDDLSPNDENGADGRDAILCGECGAPITDYVRKKDGVVWPADRIISATIKQFNRPTCALCYFKARNKAAAA